MMLSARKENGKFTEGVVLAKRIELFFRVVPPVWYSALAMTEPEEEEAALRHGRRPSGATSSALP
jgi:hypothetical protein